MCFPVPGIELLLLGSIVPYVYVVLDFSVYDCIVLVLVLSNPTTYRPHMALENGNVAPQDL